MSARPRRRPILLVVAALAALPSVAVALDAASRKPPSLGLGYEYDLSGAREEFLLPDPIADASIAPDHPLYVRIHAPWSLLEKERGLYDWSEVDRVADPYRAANYTIILCLYGGNPALDAAGRPPTTANPELLKGWLDFTRAAAFHFRGRVRYYEIWDEPNREPAWSGAAVDQFAYVLKNTSVTIRSADPEALVAQGGLAVGAASLEADLSWQEALYHRDIATYVDVLPVHPAADAPLDRVMGRAYDLILANDPSAQLWANRVPVAAGEDRERAAELLEKFIVAQGEGAAVVTFDLEADVEGQPEFPGVLLDIHKLFIPTYSRVPGSRIVFEPFDEAARGRLEGITAYQFFDSDAFQGLVGFFTKTPPPDGKARMVIDTAAVRGVGVYDIVGGAAGPIRNARPDFKTNTTVVPVFVYARPQVLQYARVAIKGFEVEKEKIQTQATGLITAEEVIAGHQKFMAEQNYRLKHYRAGALLTYHAKLGGSGTIDISFDNDFYLEKGKGPEWEQKALYYNGVKWKGEKLPELPIPQPEKVFTLPLDINLNKDYTYEYAGQEKVGGYDCYVLRFKPVAPAGSLYEGRAWIETRTFAPVRMATVQTNLKTPLISSDEKDLFSPIAGPDGTTYWLRSRVESQEILSVAGQNLVLLREIDFKDFQINDPGFESARKQAYDSNHRMLRDTDKGLQYLERTEGGGREVKEARPSALLGLVGVFRQPGLDYAVLPLAGIDYFNYKFRGKDSQINALLAGAFNTFTLTNPKTFGRKIDATVQVLALAFNVTDHLYVQGRKKEESDVTVMPQTVSGSLGTHLGNFFRVKGTYDLEYDQYGRDDKTDTFLVPSDTFIHSFIAEAEFNRAAWTVSASAQRSSRATWKPWGDFTQTSPATACDSPGSCLQQFDPAQKDYGQYSFGLSKQVFLPLFQKLHFEVTWQTGSRLDRFSEYTFTFFGNRVRGFSGSGVRYDRGGVARAEYSFNIGDVIRFDASLDTAYVRDSLTSDRFDRFTGFGVSGNLMGPWQTILMFDVGVAVQSDIPDLRGGTEFEIGLLKYF